MNMCSESVQIPRLNTTSLPTRRTVDFQHHHLVHMDRLRCSAFDTGEPQHTGRLGILIQQHRVDRRRVQLCPSKVPEGDSMNLREDAAASLMLSVAAAASSGTSVRCSSVTSAYAS